MQRGLLRRFQPVHAGFELLISDEPKQASRRAARKQIEPPHFPEWRSDNDVERCAFFIPDAIVIRAANPQGVCSAGQPGIPAKTPRSGVEPIFINAFELVLIAIFCRNAVIERNIGKLEIIMLPVQ